YWPWGGYWDPEGTRAWGRGSFTQAVLSTSRRIRDVYGIAFLLYVEVLDFADDCARHYAEIRADLKKRGALIGANDRLIAAHARALDRRSSPTTPRNSSASTASPWRTGRLRRVASGDGRHRLETRRCGR